MLKLRHFNVFKNDILILNLMPTFFKKVWRGSCLPLCSITFSFAIKLRRPSAVNLKLKYFHSLA